MQTATASFQFNGAKVTVQKPTGFSELRKWRLHKLLTQHGTDGIDVTDALQCCFYLSNTVEVEGDLHFPVPLKNVTHAELIAFIRGIGEADSALLQGWDDAIGDAISAATGNDEDLLPPEELSQKKETTPA